MSVDSAIAGMHVKNCLRKKNSDRLLLTFKISYGFGYYQQY